MIITINRSKTFDLGFLAPKNPVQILEQNERSLSLTKMDTSRIHRCNMMNFFEREVSITGSKTLHRMKAWNYVPLDAGVFQTFWENQDLIPEEWKTIDDPKNSSDFHRACPSITNFDGTVFRFSYTTDNLIEHTDCVLRLQWQKERKGWSWKWACRPLYEPRYGCERSATYSA